MFDLKLACFDCLPNHGDMDKFWNTGVAFLDTQTLLYAPIIVGPKLGIQPQSIHKNLKRFRAGPVRRMTKEEHEGLFREGTKYKECEVQVAAVQDLYPVIPMPPPPPPADQQPTASLIPVSNIIQLMPVEVPDDIFKEPRRDQDT